MYLYARCIDFSIGFRYCSENVIFCIFIYVITAYIQFLMIEFENLIIVL